MIISLIPILFVIWWVLLLGVMLPGKSFRNIIKDAADTEWNHRCVWRIYILVFVVNLVLLPAWATTETEIVMTYGGLVSVLVLGRLIIARVRHEKGAGWLFYAILIWLSPIWIPLLVVFPYYILD